MDTFGTFKNENLSFSVEFQSVIISEALFEKQKKCLYSAESIKFFHFPLSIGVFFSEPFIVFKTSIG